MSKTTRLLFLLIGTIMPIFIGLLHLFVHFSELMAPDIQDYLQKAFVYSGKSQPLWAAWGIMSFMMGFSFIVIGLLNFNTFRSLSKRDYPPLSSILVMLLYLFGVVYVGLEFDQAMQLYGGLFGMVVGVICMAITLRQKKL